MAGRNRVRLSKISTLHYIKLVGRSLLFAGALVIYILNKAFPDLQARGRAFSEIPRDPYFVGGICFVFLLEMLLRFFPSDWESMGCQKQFGENFIPTDIKKPPKTSPWPVFFIAVVWLTLNGAIGVLYLTGLIDRGILMLLCLAYSVCDMICILFFCPFQTWFMKNKCCGTCRIYNWDFAMMFTPLVFIPEYPYTWVLLGTSLLLLFYWEFMAHLRPERFSEATNGCLSCSHCKEKLCHHKTQLRSFLKKHAELLVVKGTAVVKKAKGVKNRLKKRRPGRRKRK